MGKLLIGHYGRPPEAESVEIALRDCHQRLGLKPSDFVDAEEPSFFKKAHRATGKYLVFYVDAAEIREAAVWKPGYYLLPLEAADVLRAFSGKNFAGSRSDIRPSQIISKDPAPEDVLQRARRWAEASQPLLIHCHCPEVIIKLDSPWTFRRRWRVRLTCAKRCQPPLKDEI
jgi:hypothetical protein